MKGTRPYKEILDFLKEIIKKSNYEKNHKLPSERMLATKFNASRRSIRIAYDKLIEKGLVVKVHGKGHFVTGNQPSDSNTNSISAKQIDFIVPFLRTSFTHKILSGICDFCDDNALDVSIKISKGKRESELQYINSAISSGSKGIILFPIDYEPTNEGVLKLSKTRYPLTIIDRYFKNVNASFVASDNYKAMVNAIEFLHSKKHERIVFLSAKTSVASSVEERINGFKDGIEKFYGKNAPSTILHQTTFLYDELITQFNSHLKNNPLPDVVICPGVKHITDSLLLIFNSLNLSVPKDVKLMLFDNDLPTAEINSLRPYVIEQNAYQIGYKSAATLYNQIYGDLKTENIRLSTKIIDYSNLFLQLD